MILTPRECDRMFIYLNQWHDLRDPPTNFQEGFPGKPRERATARAKFSKDPKKKCACAIALSQGLPGNYWKFIDHGFCIPAENSKTPLFKFACAIPFLFSGGLPQNWCDPGFCKAW